MRTLARFGGEADLLRRLDALDERIQGRFALRPLLREILEIMIDLTGADRAAVLLGPPPRLRIVAARTRGSRRARAPFGIEQLYRSVARRALEEGTVIVSHDAGADPRLLAGPSVAALGIRALAVFPLVFRGETVGVVYLDSRRGPLVRLEERRALCEAFARRAGLALTVARLAMQRDRACRALARAHRRLRDAFRRQGRELQQAVRAEVALCSAQSANAVQRLVGASRAMRRVFELIGILAAQDIPVLIIGETGTGKELVARAIHEAGPRRERRFVAVNCAALPEGLAESELFGHVEGAFTGAAKARAGLLETAAGGTLFLDEIGDLSPAVQAKLLRAIELGEVRRVGADEPIHVDVRIICAAHRDPAEWVAQRRFRAGLAFRLSGARIVIPPLRDRPDDTPPIAAELLRRMEGSGRPIPRLEAGALVALRAYSWPGNVRQLARVLETAVAL